MWVFARPTNVSEDRLASVGAEGLPGTRASRGSMVHLLIGAAAGERPIGLSAVQFGDMVRRRTARSGSHGNTPVGRIRSTKFLARGPSYHRRNYEDYRAIWRAAWRGDDNLIGFLVWRSSGVLARPRADQPDERRKASDSCGRRRSPTGSSAPLPRRTSKPGGVTNAFAVASIRSAGLRVDASDPDDLGQA